MENEQFDQDHYEADEWRAREIAKDAVILLKQNEYKKWRKQRIKMKLNGWRKDAQQVFVRLPLNSILCQLRSLCFGKVGGNKRRINVTAAACKSSIYGARLRQLWSCLCFSSSNFGLL
ncbi:hypothetical protein P3X46_022399 [Hevea brasiliensis]|uniref:Uncharacterized protein n=1 Tax=Hevea brasiliensis TaxID=3981 RepID=A0ABQ9LB33_HEVBR|nr:hypothetical protein P3X46_022399 [Hevea brasiliensis]